MCERSWPSRRNQVNYDQITSSVKRIVVREDRIELRINAEDSSVNMTRIQHHADTIERNRDDTKLIISAKLCTRGAEHAITGVDGKSILTTQKPDPTLTRNLAQAHEWRRALMAREFASVREIADAAKCDQRYVRKADATRLSSSRHRRRNIRRTTASESPTQTHHRSKTSS